MTPLPSPLELIDTKVRFIELLLLSAQEVNPVEESLKVVSSNILNYDICVEWRQSRFFFNIDELFKAVQKLDYESKSFVDDFWEVAPVDH